MKFIPNSNQKDCILDEMNLKDINELFSDIPKNILINNLKIEKGLSQPQVEEKLKKIAQKNKSFYEMPIFLGGGIKPHYIPSAVKSILSRSEFYSAYTPYQPEASQGFLQAMFEYQSMIAELTGMDIANASLYDGATALGEAALMCSRTNKRTSFIVPKNITWEKRCILNNYVKGANVTIKEVEYDKKTGKINAIDLQKTIDEETAGVYIENPNFFGIFEDDCQEISRLVRDNTSLFVVGVDPISLGIIKSPGEYDADIVIGEGRALGNPMDFGGSTLGIFACKKQYLRHIPGRIIGMTKDAEENRAFCMTLQTREQHIRRGKATSNICTNEGLNALAACTYLALLGGKGLERLSIKNFQQGQILAKKISSIPGYETVFSGIHFNEFVIRCPNITKLSQECMKHGIHAGLLLEHFYPNLKNCMLFGVTEMHSDEAINQLLKVLKEVS